MSKISFLILVLLATSVTSTPTKGTETEGGCIKGLLRRTLDRLRRVFNVQPAIENATATTENNNRPTGILQDAQEGLVGVTRENVDDATLPTTYFETSNGGYLNWEQEKREFHDKYDAKKLPKNMRAKLVDFKVINEIGEGSYGVVFKVVKISDGKEYAVKRFKMADEDKDKIKHEMMLLYAMNSKYISKLRYYFEEKGLIYLVIDFVDGIELFKHVAGKGRLSEDEARYSAADVVRAIEYLHNIGCIHRDIKPQNIMIDPQRHCTVIDLGLTKLLLDKPTIQFIPNKEFGTVSFAAPELVNNKDYGKPVDCLVHTGCWSTSISQGEYEGNDSVNQKMRDYTYPVPVSDEFKHLISKLLTRTVEERYDIYGIKAHPWFRHCFDGNEGSSETVNVPIPAQ